MIRCVDCHSHILPGVDDGSRSVEESLKMLRLEAQHGIRRVIATPHFYAHHDTPERFLKRRSKAWETLKSAMAEEPELPKVTLGAEVYYFPGMSESEVLSELTFGGKRFILLEMPQAPWTQSMYREMEAIYVKRGITPVIAHIDRYIAPLRTHGIPKRLEELPVLVQANAEFFLQRHTAGMALRMLQADRIHLLGSDCHNLTSRKPEMGEALRKIEEQLGRHALGRIHEYEKMIFDKQNFRNGERMI
jgi:protein-tyrosine phosphatase